MGIEFLPNQQADHQVFSYLNAQVAIYPNPTSVQFANSVLTLLLLGKGERGKAFFDRARKESGGESRDL